MGLLDEYEIIDQITEDDFGRIFTARHKKTGEATYIKQNVNPTEEDVELLKKEANILRKLSSYHSIPQAKGFYLLEPTSAALVMSQIEGGNLEALVAKYGRLQPEAATWMGERLLGTLEYAHSVGIIHCDVKPLNVMIEPKKHDIKLLGWQYSISDPTNNSKPITLPKYAAPEIAQSLPPIPESDIFGAGIVMMHALGGDAENKTLPDDTHPKLADFCYSLLRYDANERPNWDKENPLDTLSDLRQEMFGRRHTI